MSDLIKDIDDAKREYNQAINRLSALISENAARVQLLHDKRDEVIRDELEREFVGMMDSLHLRPQGPRCVADRDERVWIAARKQALLEALDAVKREPKAAVEILRRMKTKAR